MKTIHTILTLMLCGLLLLSCSKDGEQGPIGPQGEQGIQGEPGTDGIDGTDGEQGEQGETGTANVIYSDWFTPDFGEPPLIDTKATFAILDIEDLTPEIRDSGLILVYARRISGPTLQAITSLPIILLEPTNHYYYFEHSFSPTINTIQIVIRSTDETGIGFPIYKEFRYVLVPGGILTSGKSIPIDYTKMTYEEICEYFNIPE